MLRLLLGSLQIAAQEERKVIARQNLPPADFLQKQVVSQLVRESVSEDFFPAPAWPGLVCMYVCMYGGTAAAACLAWALVN